MLSMHGGSVRIGAVRVPVESRSRFMYLVHNAAESKGTAKAGFFSKEKVDFRKKFTESPIYGCAEFG
jgi:hypothetical protein